MAASSSELQTHYVIDLRDQCGSVLQRGRWKLKQLAAGQDANGMRLVGTYDVKRFRTAEVEEWGLQLV